MPTKPTVFVVDADQRARRSIEALVRTMHYSAETYASAEGFLLRRDPEKPGCAIIDLWLPDMNGIQLAGHLAAQNDRLPLILTGAKAPVRAVVRAMQLGAVTFLEKPYPADELCATLPAALEIDRKRRAQSSYISAAKQRLGRLSPQEQQVLDFMLAGSPNKVIAKRLGVSLRTVEYRRHDIFVKTETESLPELVRLVTDLELMEKTNRPRPAQARPAVEGQLRPINGHGHEAATCGAAAEPRKRNGTANAGVTTPTGGWPMEPRAERLS
jgi:FixJ family two-component response regulator